MKDDAQTISGGLLGYGYAKKTFQASLIRAVPGLKLTDSTSERPNKFMQLGAAAGLIVKLRT
jgi:hypothetical protein